MTTCIAHRNVPAEIFCRLRSGWGAPPSKPSALGPRSPDTIKTGELVRERWLDDRFWSSENQHNDYQPRMSGSINPSIDWFVNRKKHDVNPLGIVKLLKYDTIKFVLVLLIVRSINKALYYPICINITNGINDIALSLKPLKTVSMILLSTATSPASLPSGSHFLSFLRREPWGSVRQGPNSSTPHYVVKGARKRGLVRRTIVNSSPCLSSMHWNINTVLH